jgi:hypothetical protein
MRQLFTKFRVSDHSLEIESGRYKNITREERICKNCNLNENPEQIAKEKISSLLSLYTYV